MFFSTKKVMEKGQTPPPPYGKFHKKNGFFIESFPNKQFQFYFHTFYIVVETLDKADQPSGLVIVYPLTVFVYILKISETRHF